MKTWIAIVGMSMLVLAGCTKNTMGPESGSGTSVPVRVVASAGSSARLVGFGKSSALAGTLAAADSIQISEALLVVKDIKFISHSDTVHARDSSQCERDDDEDWHGRGDTNHVRLRGPFLVTLHDTTAVQVAADTIPPGVYDGITFQIHKVNPHDVMMNPSLPDSLNGYSIIVTGMVHYAGGSWAPFEFRTNLNEEYKVKGNFVVSAGDRFVPYALKFDLSLWFKDSSGRVLDPNDFIARNMIRFAIRAALGGHMLGGRDDDDDGRPD